MPDFEMANQATIRLSGGKSAYGLYALEITGRRAMAGGLGFEPRQSESESEGLPLADPPMPCRIAWS